MLSIVLSRRDFRESEQVISVLTREQGKCELLARGVKKITSKNAAHLEPFSVIDINIASGKELDYVTSVQGLAYFRAIRQNLEKSLAAQYVVELTDRLVREGEIDVRLFDALQTWLAFVGSTGDFEMYYIDCYMVTLLHCLGFSLSQDQRVRHSRFLTLIELCESGEWDKISDLGFLISDFVQFHQIVLNLAQYYTERKVVDWEKTCII